MLGIFLDSETNGLNPFKHKIIEVAFTLVDLAVGTRIESYESIILQSYEDWQASDLASLNINGFDWEEVSYGKQKELVSQEIQSFFLRHRIQRNEAVFICQNPSFDRSFFGQIIDADLQEKKNWPYHWLDLASMYWALAMKKKALDPSAPYPWQTGLSKNKIATAHKLCEEQKPHRAMNGVSHLLACYEAVVGFPKPNN